MVPLKREEEEEGLCCVRENKTHCKCPGGIWSGNNSSVDGSTSEIHRIHSFHCCIWDLLLVPLTWSLTRSLSWCLSLSVCLCSHLRCLLLTRMQLWMSTSACGVWCAHSCGYFHIWTYVVPLLSVSLSPQSIRRQSNCVQGHVQLCDSCVSS